MAVEETKQMVAMRWLDGSVVQLSSTADGTKVSTVTRRIGAAKNEGCCPSFGSPVESCYASSGWA